MLDLVGGQLIGEGRQDDVPFGRLARVGGVQSQCDVARTIRGTEVPPQNGQRDSAIERLGSSRDDVEGALRVGQVRGEPQQGCELARFGERERTADVGRDLEVGAVALDRRLKSCQRR